MKILFGAIVLAAAYSALACGVEPQGNKTATPTADATSLAAAATGTPPAAGTAAPSPAATPGDPREIRMGDEIVSAPVAADEAGRWRAFTIQGVTVEVPTGADWIVGILDDPCFGDHRRLIIVQDKRTGDRLRVDMTTTVVAVAPSSSSAALARVVRRVESSLSGVRALPTELAKAPLLPTSPACDPSAAIPTLAAG